MTYKNLDLFAGCGGKSLGFKMAGFKNVAAVEMWPPAIATYKRNHRGTRVFAGDIREVKNELYAAYSPGDFDVVSGGPPCQGYSMSGRRSPIDPRGELYAEFIDVVEHFQPRVIVMENVKGLLSMRHISPFADKQAAMRIASRIERYKELKQVESQRSLSPGEASECRELSDAYPILVDKMDVFLMDLTRIIVSLFKKAGYSTKFKVLNAANYGVPQLRERVFFMGVPSKVTNINDANIFPVATHSNTRNQCTLDAKLGTAKNPRWVTVKDAIFDLAFAPESRKLSHVFARHNPEQVKKMHALKPGASIYNYSEAWQRLVPELPAPTVKENHGGCFVSPWADRTLSPRELGELQSFPRRFIFRGTKSDILKQIGNAVPPLLARAVATSVKAYLDRQA